jgi:hypothetical protein
MSILITKLRVKKQANPAIGTRSSRNRVPSMRGGGVEKHHFREMCQQGTFKQM